MMAAIRATMGDGRVIVHFDGCSDHHFDRLPGPPSSVPVLAFPQVLGGVPPRRRMEESSSALCVTEHFSHGLPQRSPIPVGWRGR